MLQLERNMLSLALASAMAVTTGAQAQSVEQPAGTEAVDDGRATTLDAITVTGIRAGIESAIDAKKDATSIVEAVSAEDIGKLPDISIAESIARLPGLSAQRVAGRASTVSIRGFSGDYGTTLLNGREQVSVGDNRTVEFDQYPSELINAVVVYKTPDASLVGQGLSGTIDLRTVRPLAFPEKVISLNARLEDNSLGELNEGSDDRGSRFSASYIDQFMDGKLGVALGYARLESSGQAERWQAFGYPTDFPGFEGLSVLGGSQSLVSSTDNLRQGLMGVVEYKPNDVYSTTLDVFYSRFEKVETTRFLEVAQGFGDRTRITLTDPVIENGVVVAGTFNNVRPVLRNDLNTGDDKLFAIGWNNRFELGDAWLLEGDLSYSSADRQESILETYSGYPAGVFDSVDYVLDPSTGVPRLSFGLDYADPSQVVLTDAGGFAQDGYIKLPQIDDTLKSYRLSAERRFDTGMLSSVEFGYNLADREKTRIVPEAFLDLIDEDVPAEVMVPSELLLRPVDLSFTGIPGSFSYDIDSVFDRFYTLRENVNADILNKQWTVNEELSTFYVQANIDTDLGPVPVRGNIGVQVVRAEQDSSGFSLVQGDAANAVPFNGGASYTDVLPSLNLAFGLPADQTLRLGLGRQAARPRIDQLRASNNSSLALTGPDLGQWTRSGGNPELEPWRANALDLSYEKYFGGRGYVSLAYFYKDLRSYIFDQVTPFDFSGFPIPAEFVGPTPDPIGSFTRPENGEGGSLSGFELSISVPFDLFTPLLEGFGIVANHSDTDSSIKRLGPDGPDEPIAGLSDRVTNVTLYYERAGFSARISQRKRSDFLGEIQGFGADRAEVFIAGEEVVDAQVGYAFQESSALDGLSILLQVNNLTNEPYRQFFRETGLTQRYEEYGRQVLLGATYRF